MFRSTMVVISSEGDYAHGDAMKPFSPITLKPPGYGRAQRFARKFAAETKNEGVIP